MICSLSKLFRGLQLIIDDVRRVDRQSVIHASTLGKKRTESYHGSSLHRVLALMVGLGSLARSTFFIELRIEKLRPIRVKRIAFAIDRGPVPPMFVAPDPLLLMFSHELLKSVPTDLVNS